MPFIDVGELKRSQKREIEQEKINKKIQDKRDNRSFNVRRKVILGNPPKQVKQNKISDFINTMTPYVEHNSINNEEEYNDLKNTANNYIIKTISATAKDKKHVLEEKIQKSKFMKKYINKRLNMDLLEGYINEDILFCMLYGSYYFQAINNYQYTIIKNEPKQLPDIAVVEPPRETTIHAEVGCSGDDSK